MQADASEGLKPFGTGDLITAQQEYSEIIPAESVEIHPVAAAASPGYLQAAEDARSSGGAAKITCPACSSPNVQIQLIEKGQMTTKKGVGFGGHVNNAARATTAVMTLGVSNLVWKKSRGTNKTKTITATMGVCQHCGNVFEIESEDYGFAPFSIFK